MKKKTWIPILLTVALLAVLFLPIPQGAYDDGGTRVYRAFTYKIVRWNRVWADGVYEKTRIYFGQDCQKTVDELWQQEYQTIEESFLATVIQMGIDTAVVVPMEGEPELASSDQISFSTVTLEQIGATVGSAVQVTYAGGIMETHPARINAKSWKLAGDLRHKEYTEQWLDKETAEKYDRPFFDHIVITKIYANCFFARSVIPVPYEIKLNGKLSEQWCVGDQVTADYTEAYYDRKNQRVEADFTSVEADTWQPDPNAAYKPVIYLYPEEKTEVSVKLDLNGRLTCTYPAYKDGWTVTAMPDGTLTDKKGQSYNYLYWEGKLFAQYDLSEGFCVKGEDTAAFLEDALARLGLTRREANEFIVFWLPLMEQNPYNIISFQQACYTDAAALQIDPAPDTLIRVFMAWQRSDEEVQLQEQELTAPQRTGFTAVEWGGAEVKQK